MPGLCRFCRLSRGRISQWSAGISDRVDLLSLRALGALGDGVLDPLVVLEAAVTVSLDRGVVDEDVGGAVVGGGEPIALVRVEPLHCSLSHVLLLLRRPSGSTDVHPGLLRPPALPRPSLRIGGARGQNSQAL